MFQEFPKWKFKGEEAVLVEDAQEELDLGEGWVDSYFEAKEIASNPPAPGDPIPEPEPEPEDEPVALTKEELIAKADELGIEVDKRWGVERIAKAIEEASGNDA